MSSKEIAACLGVSIRTLHKYIEPHKEEMHRLFNYSRGMRMFAPKLVEYLSDKLGFYPEMDD